MLEVSHWQDQYQGSAEVPPSFACLNHTPFPERLCWSSALPSCLQCLPGVCPSSSILVRKSKQKQQPSIVPLLSSTITPLYPSCQHHSQPQDSEQAFSPFSIIPVTSTLPCSLSPEELHQIAYIVGSNAALKPSCRNSL